ncbi:hypothetical protein GCM10023149_00240 [Mucilaginibacter gynuensis]|uniref:PA14 domain-containing protein n=1 Tax=Mucilaginibacter gynuensis TaxID=1302236 RepID=A0ABP8FMB9_9SPHI
MKKINYSVFVGLLALLAVSCKQNKLDDLSAIKTDARSISGDGVITAGITKTNESVSVPFKIALSGAATKAFQIGITLNADTVNQLIANGGLPENTILIPNGSVDYPNVINVTYGSKEGMGTAIVRLSALERNYGKKLAFAFKLTLPGKGNTVNPVSSNILIVLDTKELIKEEEMHYLSFANTVNGRLNISYPQHGYTVTAAGITIPLIVNLAGQSGAAFDFKIKLNVDTIATLVANNQLPASAIHLRSTTVPPEYTIDTAIRIPTGASSGVVRLNIPWPVFDANIIPNKTFAFALSIVNPTKHVLQPTNSKVIVVVSPDVVKDNNSYITGKGTGLKAEYFSNNQQLDFDGRKADKVRIDETVDFGGDDWPRNLGISLDNYSSRWTGEFLAPVNGEYIFYQTRWDDGSRLYVNDVTLVDDFTTSWDRPERFGKIVLERGKRYKIVAHHRENVGGQQARLEFEVPGVINGRRIIPRSQLYPAP